MKKRLLELVEREQVALVIFGHDGEQWQTLESDDVLRVMRVQVTKAGDDSSFSLAFTTCTPKSDVTLPGASSSAPPPQPLPGTHNLATSRQSRHHMQPYQSCHSQTN